MGDTLQFSVDSFSGSSKSLQAVAHYTDDLLASTVISVAIILIRYSFQGFIKGVADRHKLVSKDKSLKFSESAFKLFWYLCAWTAGMAITFSDDFYWDPILCLAGYPNIPKSQALTWFYIVQFSFYVASFICQITLEVRRKDFYQMLAHHGISALLIGLSWVNNVHRFGCIVLILHDISDILLEIGKMNIYAGWRKAADAVFATLIATWAVTRLVLFPYKVLYTTLVLSLPTLYATQKYAFYFTINALLLAIQALNIWWFAMMVRLLLNVILKKKNVNDDREEDDD